MSDYMRFRGALAEAMDQRYYPIEWLDRRLSEGRAAIICSDRAALVVELRKYPGGAMDVHVLIATGEKGEIVDKLRPQAEAWGREHGCLAGVVESRPGWAKALKAHGYQVSQVTVRKDL